MESKDLKTETVFWRFNPFVKLLMICLIMFSFSNEIFSQAQVTMDFVWVPGAGTSTTADFDVILKNTGSVPLTFNSIIIRGNHALNSNILTGGTGTISWASVPGTAPAPGSEPPGTNPWNNWPNLATNLPYTSGTRLLNYSSNTVFFTNATAPTIPNGAGVNIGRFRVTVTGGTFVTGAQFGFAWSPTAAVIAYVNGASTTTSLATEGTNKITTVTTQPLGPPPSGPTASVLSGNATICSGATTNLSVAITGGTSPYTVVYNDGTNDFTVLNYVSGTNIPVSPTATTTYSLVSVTDNDNNPGTGNSGTALVTVNSLPTPVISGNLAYCAGSSTTLNAGSYASYVWTGGSTNQTLSVNTAGTYSVTVTDVNGCSGNSSVSVSENALPTPSISGNTPFCAGSSITLDAGSYASYNWSTTANSQTILVTAGGTYSVTVTDANGCTGVSSVNATMNPLPTPAITGTLSFCAGGSTTLQTTSYNAYLWTGGANTQSIVVNTAGAYGLTVTDANGCTGVTSASVTVNPLPMPTISGNLGICAGSSSILNAGSFSSYEWSTAAMTQTISVSTAGTFSVTVTDVNGCTGNSSVVTTINALPTPTISGTLSFCTGTSTTLNAGAYTSYLWSDNSTLQTLSVNTAGTFSVTVTDANGCTGVTSATTTILPNVVAGTITGVSELCSGTNSLFTSNGTSGGTWSSTNTGVATVNASSGLVTAVGAGTTAITYAHLTGCGAPVSTTVSLDVLPNYTVTATAGPNGAVSPAGVSNVCSGQNITINILPNSGYQILNVLVDGLPVGPVASYTFTNVMTNHTISATFLALGASNLTWLPSPQGAVNGSCFSDTDCCTNTFCYDLQYTPGATGTLAAYTTGFITDCFAGLNPVITNESCVMTNNSLVLNACATDDQILINSSGNNGTLSIEAGIPVIIHHLCFLIPNNESAVLVEDVITDLSMTIDQGAGGTVDEFPDYTPFTITGNTAPAVPVNGASTVQCLASAIPPTTPLVEDDCDNAITPVLISTVDAPITLTCEGVRTYTYRYTSCSGLSTDWSFVYTIDHTTAPVVPANGSSTVECPAAAIPPVTPVVVDVCGASVPAVLVSTINVPTTLTCEGTRTYNYTYTDCSGLVSNWSYEYTIDHTVNPVVPANATSTVECLANATVPTPPSVVDVCGNTITPVMAPAVDNPMSLTCEGTRTYTFTYTDCAGLVSNWSYIYTIDHSTAPVVPANGASTVQCLTAAIPPVTPTVVDVCGNAVTLVLVSTIDNPMTIECEGSRVYTYTYTDCAGLVSTWTYTYTIDRTTAPAVPANGGSTVECLSSATTPTPPVVTDICGNNVNPVLVSTVTLPTNLTCEGTRTYNYTYTDCSGLVSNWSYIYIIDHTISPVVPANGGSIVECPANATPPATPSVTDVCGANIPAVLVSITDDPVTITCEGTRTYLYSYTDCSGLVSNWSYVYTIEHSINPVVPANGAGTVQCPANAIAPVTPTVVDVCGNAITPALVSMADAPDPLTCEGTRTYVYSYTDCAGLVSNWSYVYTIDHSTAPVVPANGISTVQCLTAATPPTTPTVVDVCGNAVTPALVSMTDGPDPLTCEGSRTYVYSYTDCAGLSTNWTYVYTIDRTSSPVVPANGASSVECLADAVAPTTPVVTDVCGTNIPAVLVSVTTNPTTIVCEGIRTYTYSYTDCAGLVSTWQYVYTIDHTSAPVVPANGSATVECPSAATAPVTPTVTDVCGTNIPAVLVSIVNDPLTITCEGTRTYTYSYTDCAGLVSTWQYVYTIDHVTLPVVPANGSSTVECLADATAPTPPVVTDVCGNSITPVLASTNDSPMPLTCEGTRTYNYTYTDCAGLVSNWSYVYTVDRSTAPVIVANGSATVQCPANATTPAPPVVTDVCGNTITPVLATTVDIPASLTCEGTRTYTYTYTDCSTLVSTWTFTYTIDRTTAPIAPADGGSTVECLADATAPVTPVVNDVCGTAITPVLVSTITNPSSFSCEGTRVYNYTYTDCSGLSDNWSYTYIIDRTNIAPTEFGGPVPTSRTIQIVLDTMPPALPVIRDVCGNTLTPVGPVRGGTYVDGACTGTITFSYTYTDCAGVSIPWVYTYNVDCGQLNIKVFLEGPFNTTTDKMNTTLNTNKVLPGQDKLLSPSPTVQVAAPFTPFGQPYSVSPWSYNGNSGAGFGDPTAPGAPGGVTPYPSHVVDWVLVTVRENGILPANNTFTCAAWLHTNGQVTFPEACSGLTINASNDYYVVIQHRNHLGVLDTASVMAGGTHLAMDFTVQDSYKPTFRFGQKQVKTNVWALFAANSNQTDSQSSINSADRSVWRLDQNKVGYFRGDHNMNVTINSQDETFWKVNQNKTTGVVFY